MLEASNYVKAWVKPAESAQIYSIFKIASICYVPVVESTMLFFHNISAKCLNRVELIDKHLLKLSEEQLTRALFYGFSQLDQNQKRNILSRYYQEYIESKRVYDIRMKTF